MRKRPCPRALAAAATVALAALAPRVHAYERIAAVENLADLSLEQLGNLRVTTAALRPERYSDTPASIYVIRGEDIRRAGATSLPEALRLAPNLEVAQVSASSYAITARGFENVVTNKLLVLLDGRTLYTTVLSGVLWDAQDVMLDDVDRIEVISGPGAALYGANAFAGVINIITRSAADTQGARITAGASDVERNAAARYGGRIGQDGAWRAYAMHVERDNLRPAASGVPDALTKDQAGFRADFGSPRHGLTVQGDAYNATKEGNGGAGVSLGGANLLARWTAPLGGSRLAVQAYVDHTRRDDPATFKDRVDTYDVQVQDDLPALGRHSLSFGVGYRYALDDTTPTPIVRFVPEDRRLHWGSAAAQDAVALAHDVTLILGARVQTDAYVKPVFLPDVRLAWKPRPRSLVWASASRVARTPGRIDRDFRFPGNPPFLIAGGPDFDSETGRVYEVGYRGEPAPWLTYSLAAYYQRYANLRGGRLAADGSGFVISNEIEGHGSGLEAWAIVQPDERWRLSAGLLEMDQDLHPRPGGTDVGGPAALGNDPRHTVKLRGSYRFSDDLEVELAWRYVSALSYLATVPGYDAVDARVAWRITPHVEVSVRGSNLFDPEHVEFDEHGLPAPIPRQVYAQLRLDF